MTTQVKRLDSMYARRRRFPGARREIEQLMIADCPDGTDPATRFDLRPHLPERAFRADANRGRSLALGNDARSAGMGSMIIVRPHEIEAAVAEIDP